MGMAAAAWDMLAKAANLAQMSGLHAAMLVAVLTAILRIQQSNSRECARLERCQRRLHALLQWPASGGVALLLPCSETAGDPFGQALADAAGLVVSYKNSTLWCRVWNGSRMATQLRDMQDVVDSYCGLLLCVNAHLLLHQQTVHRPTTIPEVIDDTSQIPSAQAVTTSRPAVASTRDTQEANDIGQGRMDNDPATGCERNVPADLLPAYSDFPGIKNCKRLSNHDYTNQRIGRER